MPTEEDLRAALASGVSFIYPDVDEELDRALARATARTRTRLASYTVGLAAAVALVLLLVGHDWRPQADGTPPATPVPVRELPSGVGRYANPADIDPGRWNVDFLPDSWPHRVEADIDVPAGWGQDDRFALATGPAGDPATRRIDFFTGREAQLAWCPGLGLGFDPSTLEVASALDAATAMAASTPEPVRVGGHPGYFVELRDDPSRQASVCPRRDTFMYTVPGTVERCRGFTTLAWILDVDGRVVSVYGSYGPDTTDAQAEEIVRMVESAEITAS